MPPFPLSHVCSDLIQKIITKLDSTESYCRLRQTCKLIDQIAQNNCHMIVKGRWYLKITHRLPEKREQEPLLQMQLDQRAALEAAYTYRSFCALVQLCCFRRYKSKVVNLRSFHRFTLSILEMDRDTDHGDSFCEFLRDHRITCQTLIITCDSNLTMAECRELIRVLKPTEVDIDSTLSKRFEAVLLSEGVKNVTIRIEIEHGFQVAKQFLSLVENMTIHVKGSRNDDWWYTEMSDILNDLHLGPILTLQSFTLVYYPVQEPRPSMTQEIMNKFASFGVERRGDTGRQFEIRLGNGEPVVNIRW